MKEHDHTDSARECWCKPATYTPCTACNGAGGTQGTAFFVCLKCFGVGNILLEDDETNETLAIVHAEVTDFCPRCTRHAVQRRYLSMYYIEGHTHGASFINRVCDECHEHQLQSTRKMGLSAYYTRETSIREMGNVVNNLELGPLPLQ